MRFQWLRDYKEIEGQIEYLKWNLNRSELELIRWVEGDLVNVKLEKNSRSSNLENDIEKLKAEIERLEQNKKEVVQFIETFEGVENQIIKLKYIDGHTLEEIAEEIGYSASYVRKKHSEIKNLINFITRMPPRDAEPLRDCL